MSETRITVEDFQPLVEAMEEQINCKADFEAAQKKAIDLLARIRERQDEDSENAASMLAALRKEEKTLRRKVREQTAERARAILRGETPLEVDRAAGGRLAAIPDEIAALERIEGERIMTNAEREAWENVYSALEKSAISYMNAQTRYEIELKRWSEHIGKELKIATSTNNINAIRFSFKDRANELDREVFYDDDFEEEDDSEDYDEEDYDGEDEDENSSENEAVTEANEETPPDYEVLDEE